MRLSWPSTRFQQRRMLSSESAVDAGDDDADSAVMMETPVSTTPAMTRYGSPSVGSPVYSAFGDAATLLATSPDDGHPSTPRRCRPTLARRHSARRRSPDEPLDAISLASSSSDAGGDSSDSQDDAADAERRRHLLTDVTRFPRSFLLFSPLSFYSFICLLQAPDGLVISLINHSVTNSITGRWRCGWFSSSFFFFRKTRDIQ